MRNGCLGGMLVAMLIAAGCTENSSPDVGSADVALTSVGPDGASYRLTGATFEITGAESATLRTDDFPEDARRTVELAVGDYEIRLVDGWTLVRTAGDDQDGPVEATLITANPRSFVIEAERSTAIDFSFMVDDEDIILSGPHLDLGIDILFPNVGDGFALTDCEEDADCDDARYCSGVETCDPSDPAADARGCVAGARPCGDAACDELRDECPGAGTCDPPASTCLTDADCGDDGLQCNGSTECDPGNPSADARGCVATAAPTCANGCDEEVGCLPAPSPCTNDRSCGGRCRGYICDSSHPSADARGCHYIGFSPDAFCGATASVPYCWLSDGMCHTTPDPTGYDPNDYDGDGVDSIASGGGDCDDDDARRFPGNPETCSQAGLDNDCNPATVAGTAQFGRVTDGDADGDGFISELCWNDNAGGDDTRGRDCDDDDPGVHPLATEVCNGRDDDCDGEVDEHVSVAIYRDEDGDGFGRAGCTFVGCGNEPGFATNADDCADYNPALRPGTGECNDALHLGVCVLGEVIETACHQAQRCYTGVDGVGRCR